MVRHAQSSQMYLITVCQAPQYGDDFLVVIMVNVADKYMLFSLCRTNVCHVYSSLIY